MITSGRHSGNRLSEIDNNRKLDQRGHGQALAGFAGVVRRLPDRRAPEGVVYSTLQDGSGFLSGLYRPSSAASQT